MFKINHLIKFNFFVLFNALIKGDGLNRIFIPMILIFADYLLLCMGV